MEALNKYLESLLDVDFDVDVTVGDKYMVILHFANKAPSNFNGREWKHEQFWANYDMSNYPRLQKIIPARLQFLKRDIRHGLVAYILAQPLCKIDKQFIKNCTTAMNKLCDRKSLIIDADLRGGKLDRYEINLYNTRKATTSVGYFELIPKTNESLLDADFDVDVQKIIDTAAKCKTVPVRIEPKAKLILKKSISTDIQLPKDRMTWNGNDEIMGYINRWICEQPMSWVDAEDGDAFLDKFKRELLTSAGKRYEWSCDVEAAYPDSYGCVKIHVKVGTSKHATVGLVQIYMK